MKLLLMVFLMAVANAQQPNQSPSFSNLQNDENLLQQFRKWQQSVQPHQQQEEDSVLTKNYGGGGGYPNNPWIQPQPQPQPQPIPPPTRPPYIDNQNNPWYQPPVQPQPDPYPQPAPQPLPKPLPYPPQILPIPPNYPPSVTGAPPPSNYPPAVTSAPPTPEVEALRRYCLKPRGQFPTRSCNRYVNCWDDVIIEQECPSGLLFSERGYCDYEFNVDCTGRSLSGGGVTPPPELPEGQKTCPTLFGNYRSTQNCSEFFVCVHGSPIKFCCPSGLYYSTELGVCDYAYNVHCINPRPLYPPQPYPQPQPYPLPQPLPRPTTEVPPPWNPYSVQRLPADLFNEKRSCIPNSVYGLDPDCLSVALCREGKTEVITCGQHTAYNADQGLCVAKHLAKC